MGKKYKFFLLVVALAAIGLATALFIALSRADVLNPAGEIARKEFNLMIFTVVLMLVIIIPVFVMTFMIAWKYREGNKKNKKYSPTWDGSRLYESIWWGFPMVIILILSVVTWQSSHDLDPFKPIVSSTQTMTIQVVAMQWKWLFIYPEEKIATINYVQFPARTPIKFEITSDGPMNSFWIPRLGGQMYAMSGMSTKLNLMADGPGVYNGSSANISGEGFASMKFKAKSTSKKEFYTWVDNVRSSTQFLDAYKLSEVGLPSKNNPPAFYSYADAGLYNEIMTKHMNHMSLHMDGH